MIQIFNSQKPGPNLVVMAGVHGNEPCGLAAFNEILPYLSINSGTVTFIIGNPKAVEKGTREFEANLNRLFRANEDLTTFEKSTYEYRRSRELMPILTKADALLDIHSSTTEDSLPFIICEPQSYDCAKVLPADIVVSGIDKLHPTGTDAFVNLSGGIGICIECGQHTDPAAKEIAIQAIKNFLQFFGVFSDSTTLIQKQPQTYISAEWLYKNQDVFTLSRKFKEFEKISRGDVIGTDGSKEIYAPDNGCILFPNDTHVPNSEAFIFAQVISTEKL